MKLTINRLLLIILIAAYIILSIAVKRIFVSGLIDWYTIWILASLIVVNAALLSSGGIDRISFTILQNFNNKRTFFLFSVVLTLLLSMFLTNDVALLVLVPITVSIGKFSREDVDDVIIFQAIAANVGSMLMPFGNPQNIIIYRESVRNFVLFLKVMFPPFLISSFLLLIIIMLLKTGDFKNKLDEAPYVNMYLFIPNFVLLLIIILAFLLGWPYYIFTLSISISIISMLLNEPSNLSKVDVGLILTFILIFYDVNLAREILRITIPHNAIDIYVYSLILSQFISNVPTTVLFGKVANWPALAYGVDIGGNGTLVASLANLIAFRNMRVKDILRFTKFSFLFLFITCIIGALLLMIL